MATDTLEKTDVEEDLSDISPNDPDRAAHAFRKTMLDKFMFGEISEVVAVCGFKTTSIFKPINGRPVCKTCSELLAIMRD